MCANEQAVEEIRVVYCILVSRIKICFAIKKLTVFASGRQHRLHWLSVNAACDIVVDNRFQLLNIFQLDCKYKLQCIAGIDIMISSDFVQHPRIILQTFFHNAHVKGNCHACGVMREFCHVSIFMGVKKTKNRFHLKNRLYVWEIKTKKIYKPTIKRAVQSTAIPKWQDANGNESSLTLF